MLRSQCTAVVLRCTIRSQALFWGNTVYVFPVLSLCSTDCSFLLFPPVVLLILIRAQKIFIQSFKGIIIPKHRAVGLTSTVAKTSTGAIQHVPVSRVGNINQTIDQLKDAGFWIVGTDGGAKTDYRDIPGDVNLAIIIGNEGSGISKKTLEKCDFTVTIPMVGTVSSLNASVSAALLMYEVYRKHQPRTSKG